MSRTCLDCPATITERSKGRCRACTIREISKRPGLAKARGEKTRATRMKPEVHEKHRLATIAGKQAELADPARREAYRQQGRDFGKQNFWQFGDEAAQEAGRLAVKRAWRAWCPEEYWSLADKMKATGIMLDERKAIILAEVEGTPEHARRTVANHIDAQRIRHERDRLQAY